MHVTVCAASERTLQQREHLHHHHHRRQQRSGTLAAVEMQWRRSLSRLSSTHAVRAAARAVAAAQRQQRHGRWTNISLRPAKVVG